MARLGPPASWGGRAVLTLSLALAALAAARGAVALEPAPVAAADTLASSELPVGLEEVIGELDLADQPAARRDLAVAGSEGRSAAGSLAWRSGATPDGPRHDARLELRADRLSGRGTLRLRPGESAAAAGAMGLRLGPARVWAGHLALRHGFGLATSDAGRRGSLAADQSLGGIAGGLSPRTGSGAGDAGMQAGAAVEHGGWRLEGLGSLVVGSSGRRPWAARIATGGGSGDRRHLVAVAAGADTGGTFASLAVRTVRPGLSASWEVAGIQPTGAAGPGRVGAAVCGITWQPLPPFRLELQSGAATGPLSGRAAVLPGGARRGWAVRAAWRDRNSGTLEVLAQGSRAELDQPEAIRRETAVVEAAWERGARGGLVFELRCRRTSRRDTAWPALQPWLPGIPGEPAVRTSLAAGIRHELGGTRAELQWRAFTVAGAATEGSRQALSLGGSRRWAGRWEAWCDATTAWGDGVDLVRALVPLPGVVAARHWGHWRAETLVGLGWLRGPLSVRAALARRLPDDAAADLETRAAAAWEAWLEARGSW